jgi:hypothetical protein
MRRRLVHLAIFTAFGVGLGHGLFLTFGPAGVAEYRVGGTLEVLRAPEPRGRSLYLRRTLHLAERPRWAWVQLLGPDHVELYANGVQVQKAESDADSVTFAADLASYLHAGNNVVAAVVQQETLGRLPELSVQGAYGLSDGEHPLGTEGVWRCGNHLERGADYWFTVEFDDTHWPMAVRASATLHAEVKLPSVALTGRDRGKWITPDQVTADRLIVRRMVEVPASIESAWLRLQCTAPYYLTINGELVEAEESQLGITAPVVATQWVYDVSTFMRRGANAVSITASTEQPPVHLRADLEVTTRSGTVYREATDGRWQWRSLTASRASEPTASAWRACVEESGDAGLLPWETTRRQANTMLPTDLQIRLCLQDGALMLLTGLSAWLCVCWLERRYLTADRLASAGALSPAVLALVPVVLLAAIAMTLADNVRIAAQQVYRPLWVVLPLGLVVLQWVALVRRRRRAPSDGKEPRAVVPWLQRPGVVWGMAVLVVAVGAYLRLRDVTARPLSPDEVSMYRGTVGFFEHGYPSIVIHPDIPVVYATTSELVYCSSAFAALVFDNERLIIRMPTAFWGTLTIILLYACGKRLFRPWVGVLAAALYALAPFCIEMADYGRYYSQLQALTLLTVYFFYRTIEPPGPLNRRALWLTVAGFIGMYFSWEGSALIAPPLMLAAVIQRRDRLRTLLLEPAVWQGMVAVGAVVVLQSSIRNLVQIGRPLFGSGASDIALTPMWRYPGFDLWYYVRAASWNADSWLPMLGLCGAGILALRHPFHRPVRVLLIIFLSVALFQALVLPVTAQRYAYHFLPMWALLAAAAGVAGARPLSRVWAAADGAWRSCYARGISATVLACGVLLGCGLQLESRGTRGWGFTGGNLEAFKQPGQEPSAQFVLEHMQPDDVVICNGPHVIDHYLGRNSDYWLQTQMHLQATMDDKRVLPLHRLKGAVMLRDLDHVKEVFARHPRVWFITEPGFNALTNVEETTAFLRANMEVVYEDYSSLVLFAGAEHRSAGAQLRTAASLTKSETSYLP